MMNDKPNDKGEIVMTNQNEKTKEEMLKEIEIEIDDAKMSLKIYIKSRNKAAASWCRSRITNAKRALRALSVSN